ncbi:MAG TPA: amidohydrolase family protein [Pyrinomonadaceae bacterium]|nr:amidohydrolase family protein [Pyrinomonadaceae bacterium]
MNSVISSRRTIICAALLWVFIALLVGTGASSEAEVMVIEGATVIDCTGKPPIINGVVVIEGGKIKAVGRQGKVTKPPGARVVSAHGKYILPGLIDMHVHYREWHGELFLANGITTIKDLGNPVEWISELSRMQSEGKLRGPRIFYTGNNLDVPPPEGDHNVGVPSPEVSERAVNLLFKLNVNAIKVRHKITPESLSVIVKAAHARGIPVTGHLGATNASEAALAGIDGLEHASGVALAAAETPGPPPSNVRGLNAFLEDLRGFAQMSRSKEAALIKLLVTRKVKLIPTLAIRRRAVVGTEGRERAVKEDDQIGRHPQLAYVPETVRRNWREAPLDKGIQQTFSKEQMQLMREGYQRLEEFVRELHRAGGFVLAGSDNLNDVPGLTLHRELESLVEAGLTPMEALIAATRDAAQFLRRRDLGTIEPGRTADLIIVQASPLENIRNLDVVEKVFQNGKEIEIGFHHDYALPPARPSLVRPLFLERLLAEK